MFMKKLVLSAMLSGILAPLAHAQTTQVVDNQDPGFSITAGTWVSSASIGGFIGDNYLNTGDTTSFNQVQWQLTTTDSSNYDVAARWTAFGNRTSRATYSITHANGVTHVTVNQRINGGEFVSLGVFESPTRVQLSNDGIDGFVVADAIQAQPTAGETTGSANINLDACFGDEYFDDGTGLVKYDPALHTDIDNSTQFVYRGEEYIVPIFLSPTRGMSFHIRNLSASNLNFFYTPNFFDDVTGLRITQPTTLSGTFTESNSPLFISGATLPPDQLATISHGFGSRRALVDGKVRWETTDCLKTAPIISTVETTIIGSGAFRGISIYPINNGNPW